MRVFKEGERWRFQLRNRSGQTVLVGDALVEESGTDQPSPKAPSFSIKGTSICGDLRWGPIRFEACVDVLDLWDLVFGIAPSGPGKQILDAAEQLARNGVKGVTSTLPDKSWRTMVIGGTDGFFVLSASLLEFLDIDKLARGEDAFVLFAHGTALPDGFYVVRLFREATGQWKAQFRDARTGRVVLTNDAVVEREAAEATIFGFPDPSGAVVSGALYGGYAVKIYFPIPPSINLPSPWPIALWTMDDPVNASIIDDYSGHNHAGNLRPQYTQITTAGHPGVSIIPQQGWNSTPAPGSSQALLFDGAYAEVPHDPSLNIDPSRGFRIEMWVDATDTWGVGIQPLLCKYHPYPKYFDGYALYLATNINTQTWDLVFWLNETQVILSRFPMSGGRRVVVMVAPSGGGGGTVTLCRDTDLDDSNGYEACTGPIPVPSIATTNNEPLLIGAVVGKLGGGTVGQRVPASNLTLDEVKIFDQP